MTVRETERYELFFCPDTKAYRVMDNYTAALSDLIVAPDTWEEANQAAYLPEDAFEGWCEAQLGYTPFKEAA